MESDSPMARVVMFVALSLVLVPAAAVAQPCANPGPPTGVAAAVAGQRVILTWAAPAVPNECPITGYWVGIGYEPGQSDARETDTAYDR